MKSVFDTQAPPTDLNLRNWSKQAVIGLWLESVIYTAIVAVSFYLSLRWWGSMSVNPFTGWVVSSLVDGLAILTFVTYTLRVDFALNPLRNVLPITTALPIGAYAHEQFGDWMLTAIGTLLVVGMGYWLGQSIEHRFVLPQDIAKQKMSVQDVMELD